MRHKVRLNEAQLHNVIKESVKKLADMIDGNVERKVLEFENFIFSETGVRLKSSNWNDFRMAARKLQDNGLWDMKTKRKLIFDLKTRQACVNKLIDGILMEIQNS